MLQKSVVTTSAWLEIVTGAALLAVVDIACRLLFAATPEGPGRLIGRFAGIALFALGIACLPSRVAGSRSRAVEGLLAYNVGVTILLSWVGIATMFRGVLLWPAVVLHAIIAIALFAGIFRY
jgi:hypothetical protein